MYLLHCTSESSQLRLTATPRRGIAVSGTLRAARPANPTWAPVTCPAPRATGAGSTNRRRGRSRGRGERERRRTGHRVRPTGNSRTQEVGAVTPYIHTFINREYHDATLTGDVGRKRAVTRQFVQLQNPSQFVYIYSHRTNMDIEHVHCACNE